MKSFMKEKHLPLDVRERLRRKESLESEPGLKFFAEKRLKANDLLALYCYEVESTRIRSEKKTDTAASIGMSFRPYKTHVDRGRKLKENM